MTKLVRFLKKEGRLSLKFPVMSNMDEANQEPYINIILHAIHFPFRACCIFSGREPVNLSLKVAIASLKMTQCDRKSLETA